MDRSFPFAAVLVAYMFFAAGAVVAVAWPPAAKGLFFIGFAFSLGMLDRSPDRGLWSWCAVFFGLATVLAVLIAW